MGKDKKGGLYESWLKNFTINVMTQSFHAFFLMFVMKMLSELSKLEAQSAVTLTNNDGLLSIMSIVGMMAIIKFEKLIKGLFGMKDGLSGDLKGAGMKMFMGLKAAGDLGREIKQPFQKSSESRKRMTALGKDIGINKSDIGRYAKPGTRTASGVASGLSGKAQTSPLSEKTQDLYNKMKDAKKEGNMDLYKDYRDHAATQMKYEKAASTANVRAANASANSGSSEKTRAQKLEEYNDAVLENRKNSRKKWAHTAGTLASLSIGFGAVDETAEAVQVANIINNPINNASSRYIDHGENITARKSTGDSDRYNERAIGTAIKEGFEKATTNMRNSDGKLNPIKISVETAKTYSPISTAKAVTKVAKASKVDSIDDI